MPETGPFAEQDLTDRKRPASGRGSGASHEIGLNGGRAHEADSAPRTHVFAERDLNGVERPALRRGVGVPNVIQPDWIFIPKTAPTQLALIAVLFLFAPSSSLAAPKATVHKSTKTTNVPIVQSINFQKHPLVASPKSEVDGRLVLATDDLKRKDSPSDVACPVKLRSPGALLTFPDPTANSALLDINSLQDIQDLITALDSDPDTPTAHAAVVRRIDFCRGPTTAYGCTTASNLMMFSTWLGETTSETTYWDHTTAAHEVGHFRGLDDVSNPARIMHNSVDGSGHTGAENEVISSECRAFQIPVPI